MSERAQRQLSAILAADVAGYSRLIGLDEEGTLARLKDLRQTLIDPKISEHRGRIVKTMGDGLLVQFASAVDAVRCAVAIQRFVAEQNVGAEENLRIEFRIGINVGDIVIDGEDIQGDGVNIAARLEALAEPGGICVSGSVHDHVHGKLDATLRDMGERHLKNITRAVRVYGVSSGTPMTKPTLPLPTKPSIAVLPFQNMTADPEQEYFADGMVDEIITALSRFEQLFVIARNSSFTYKNRNVDVKQVGRELGVRYVLEGSVRKAGNKVRITGQLIDSSTSAHLWADHFDGGLDDVFNLQDQVTASVVGAIAPKVEQAELERSRQKPTENLDAYDYYLRAIPGTYRWTKEANAEALGFLYRAIEIDPNFAAAYGMAARCYGQRRGSGWDEDRPKEIAETRRLVRRAVELGRNDAVALATAGLGLTFVCNDPEGGAALIDRALGLNPNLALGWAFSGWARVWSGEPDKAIEHLNRAMRLSPNDPNVFNMQAAMACAHFIADRFAEAASWGDMARRLEPNHLLATSIVAASNALLGNTGVATEAVSRLRQLDPSLCLSNLGVRFVAKRKEDLDKYTDALRKAGLPE